MSNIKKITITLNDGTKNGQKISFEPKFDAHISVSKGIGQTNSFGSMIPEFGHNGREAIVILCAPKDILEVITPMVDSTVKALING